MKKLLKDDQPVNREKILRAAIDIFTKKGYQRTTIREISTKSKLSIGTIYFHFKNKEEILKEVFGREELIKMSSVTEKIGKVSIEELAKEIYRGLIKNMDEKFEVLLLYINSCHDISKLNKFFYEQFKDKTGELTKLFEQLIKNGGIRKMNPEKAAIFVLGNVLTMAVLKKGILKKNLDENFYEEMIEFIIDIFKNGVFK